jgi:hypothetical protein
MAGRLGLCCILRISTLIRRGDFRFCHGEVFPLLPLAGAVVTAFS